ncbi:MAG: SEC-C domain-containing protein [Rhodocyclales bacterium]|nr:SEC-C domain-containing protein [Rhodocyclales bacterium]
MRTRTPLEVTKQLIALAAKVAPGKMPVYVSVHPEPDALVNECFHNVAAKIKKDGGAIVYGWQLWEWPNVLVEGEFHAIWRSPEGNLVDVTPKADNEERGLFVPDERRAYRGVSIDNVRVALRDDLLIYHFIKISEEIVKVMNRGERAQQFGYVGIPADEIEPLLQFQNLTREMLRRGLRAHDNCLCGSGKKYKRCHGKLLS